MALCATTALAGAVSRLCVRGARGRFGGGSGRYLVLCLSCFPLPAPRVPRCVRRAVPSGCPLPSLAGTPFHAVCAFRALGPVAIPVVPACPFRVCALALSRCPLPPPLGGVARASRVVPALGALFGRSTWSVPLRVSCPGPVLRLACLGGGGPVPVPPYLAWGCGGGGPWPPVLWSGQPGFRVPRVLGAVGAGVGSPLRPHSVSPCGPVLLAVGVAEGRPRGGCFPPLCGAPGVRRCPSPGRPSSGAGCQGSATRVSRVRSIRACVPSTGPPACALAGRRCSLWGWWKGVPGGGAFHRCEGRLVSGAVPPPAARPLERAARVPRPVCPGCGRCGRVDPAPAPQRAPLRAGVARCGGGGRASPGGVPSTVL